MGNLVTTVTDSTRRWLRASRDKMSAPTQPIVKPRKSLLRNIPNQEVLLVLCFMATSLLACDTCKAGTQNNTVTLSNGDIRWDDNDTIPGTVQRVLFLLCLCTSQCKRMANQHTQNKSHSIRSISAIYGCDSTAVHECN